MDVAKNMGRIDAYNVIYIGYAFGLRIEEVCRIRLEDIEKALKYYGLTIKGNGGVEKQINSLENWMYANR